MNPNVSIVLPTYNRAHILSKAIDSVLSQTYANFELIVTDDCSTDDTKRLIDSYTDKRLHYVHCPRNMGAAGARNFGAAFSCAPFLAFQDSDTVWSADKLERQMNYMSEHPDISLVFHSFLSIKEAQKILEPNQKRLASLSTSIFNDLLFGPLVDTPTILMHTEIFRHCQGFLETLKSHEDYEFSLRVAKDFKIGHLMEPLLHSYHTENGVNSNYREILRANFYILNLYSDIISSHPDMEAAQLERLFYYTLVGNEGQYFFDELASYVIATDHRNLYYDFEKKYNAIRDQLEI